MKRSRSSLCVSMSALVLAGCAAADAGPSADLTFSETPALEQSELRRRLARTPPMGFNTWNNFGPGYDEALILEIADALVSSGMRDAGYVYVGIDDAWQRYPGSRAEHPGPLEPDPQKFPHGIKYVADYLHARGLKLGLYSGGDHTTCAGFTGSLGHEDEDARTFASWGVDFLKYDSCCTGDFTPPRPDAAGMRAIQRDMAQALARSGRDVIMSAVNCGWDDVHTWARAIGGHMWRINQDIADMFEGPWPEDYYMPIKAIIDRSADPALHYSDYAGPGGWNDMDMLVVGLRGRSANAANMPGAGCSDDEYRTHFSLWCMMASPLLAGNDVRRMDRVTTEILTNRELIALDQDPLGVQAERVRKDGELEYFVKPLANGDVAVAMLNAGAEAASMRVDFARDAGIRARHVHVRDLWQHRSRGLFFGGFTAHVRSHETVVLRLSARR